MPASSSGQVIDFTSQLATAVDSKPANVTIERILGNFSYTVPASTAAGRSYSAFLAVDIIDADAHAASAFPEPFSDQKTFPWVDGRRVFADHTVPASYAAPGINGTFIFDMRSKRRLKRGEILSLFGYHDNGLAANPTLYWTYSALWRLHS